MVQKQQKLSEKIADEFFSKNKILSTMRSLKINDTTDLNTSKHAF